jgi:hypothetical protein
MKGVYMTSIELVNELNASKFMAFSKKPAADGTVRKGANVSILCEDGKRRWLDYRQGQYQLGSELKQQAS